MVIPMPLRIRTTFHRLWSRLSLPGQGVPGIHLLLDAEGRCLSVTGEDIPLTRALASTCSGHVVEGCNAERIPRLRSGGLQVVTLPTPDGPRQFRGTLRSHGRGGLLSLSPADLWEESECQSAMSRLAECAFAGAPPETILQWSLKVAMHLAGACAGFALVRHPREETFTLAASQGDTEGLTMDLDRHGELIRWGSGAGRQPGPVMHLPPTGNPMAVIVPWLTETGRPPAPPHRIQEILAVMGAMFAQAQATHVLTERIHRMEQMAEVIPVAFWRAQGLELRLLYANRACRDLMGLDPSEVGQPLFRSLRPSDRIALMTALRRVWDSSGEEVLSLELNLPTPDGKPRPCMLRGIATRDATGRMHDWVGLLVDLRNLQEQADLRREMDCILAKGQMAAYVSHEINGPLAGIKSAFVLLQEALAQDHPYAHYAPLITQEIERIGRNVRTTHELYRPRLADPVEQSVTAMLREVTQLLEPRFRAAQVRLEISALSPVTARVSPDLLRLVLFNLLATHLDGLQHGGIVTCRLEASGPRCVLCLETQGVVIPRLEGLPRSGLGLGSETTSRLLEAMGGTLSTDDLSRVVLTLPLNPSA